MANDDDDKIEDAQEEKVETHEEASARRKKHLDNRVQLHLDNVEAAHKRFPTTHGRKFTDMPIWEQRNFRMKQEIIAQHNQKYFADITSICQEHQQEIAAKAAKQEVA
jgi:hypothetical protein